MNDLRYALRQLRRAPTFAVTVVLILGLGIGMATAMFTIFRAVVLQQLPVRDPDRVVVLWTFRDPTVELPLGRKEVDDLRRESRTLANVAGFAHWGAQVIPVTDGDRPIVLKQAMVTAGFFDVLGARPVLGRLLRPEDGFEGAAPVAVVSYQTWQRDFGGDPRVLGRRLTTTQDQRSYAIVGVTPPGLDFPVGTDYWIGPRPFDLIDVVARLALNATPASAQSEFLSIARQLDPERRTPVYPTGAAVRTLTQAVLGDTKPILVALTAAVTLLLLIVCVNVSSLLLLRASRRAPEIVMRRALGASSRQIARLLVAESALLAMAGGALGLVCAAGLLHILPAFAPARVPRMDVIRLAGTPVDVAAGVTLVTVMLFGVVSALVAARGDLASLLRIDSRSGTETRRRRRFRQSLVASQVALAVVMLAGAGLLVRSLERLERLDLGYETDHLSIVDLAVPFSKYGSPQKVFAMFDDLYGRLRAVPGVTAFTPVLYPPFLGANLMQVTPVLEGQSRAAADATPNVPLEGGGTEYFRTFGIPILRGRGFLPSDRESAPKIVVVSEAVARRLWPGQDPVGKRVRFLGGDPTDWRTVVGVAGDIRFRRLKEATPTIYLPWHQLITFGTFAVRTRDALASALPAMRRAVREFDSEMDVWDARTMDAYVDEPLAQPRLSTLLLSAFGLVGLLLAAIGLYGMMASAVQERTRDLGVRLALGATPGRLRREVLGAALSVTSVGAVVGLAAALVSSRLLTTLLFEVSPTDPITLAGVSVVLLGVGVGAAYVPARRAMRIDPAHALRAE